MDYLFVIVVLGIVVGLFVVQLRNLKRFHPNARFLIRHLELLCDAKGKESTESKRRPDSFSTLAAGRASAGMARVNEKGGMWNGG